MKTMYPAQVNSPGTELAGAIDAAQDTIQVADGSVLPDGPNLLTIGTDEAAETILYTGKTGDELTGVTRGFQGTAQSWAAGTKVARYFTAYDHDAAVSNISELSTGLKALGDAARDRLDIVEHQDVVLKGGLQILNAQRRAAFSLNGIKGRTLVNLLGRDGGCESLSPFVIVNSVAINNTKVKDGSGSLKATTTNNNAYAFKDLNVILEKTKQYMLAGWVYIESYTQISGGGIAVQLRDFGTMDGKYSANADPSRIGEWQFVFTKISASNTLIGSGFRLLFGLTGVSTGAAYFDSIRLYELSNDEYTALDAMTPEQIGSKYPYVDSVQPVRNPYAIRYGENLLPPFHEWNTFSHATIRSLYEYSQVYTNGGWSYVEVPVHKDKEYNLSFEGTGGVKIAIFQPGDGGAWITDYSSESFTFNSGNNSKIRVVIAGDLPGNIKNPMLTLGSDAKPFKPREDSKLALQTDLCADPLTGMNADEVFEKDGQYFKLAKWKKVVSAGNQTWEFHSNGVGGFKKVKHKIPLDFPINGGQYAVKFDGKILKQDGSTSTVDSFSVFPFNGATTDINGYVFYQISNTDSGWGDNYSPTADEIKAYFMGWRMFQWGVGYDPYNGTGTKGWGKIYSGVGPNDGNGMVAGSGVSTLPTTMNDMGYTPYQLVYQLATPTVEPIVSEGMLTFNEGDNQIEVGTGIVVREGVKIYDGEPQGYGAYYYTNHTTIGGGSKWKYKPVKVLSFYRNSLADDSFATNMGVDPWSRIKKDLYDPSATYSVTYLMLDTSPIVPFSGSYAANEKAMLQELTDAVQQNATAVSVLTNKKADKDSPGWITPTLLNGWAQSNIGFSFRVINNHLEFKGVISSSSPLAGTFMVLPTGMRPKTSTTLGTVTYGSSTTIAHCLIDILTDGKVAIILNNPYTNVTLEGLTIPLE